MSRCLAGITMRFETVIRLSRIGSKRGSVIEYSLPAPSCESAIYKL